MRIVVCAKEVLDPDAVNNYALAGGLQIGADGKTLTQTAIPRLMNAYDEQAIEAALRLRDGGLAAKLAVVSAGADPASILRQAAALGADETGHIQVDAAALDLAAIAKLLAAYVTKSGGADLILCGRQASDDDQGVVPALLGELLGMPVVTVARAVAMSGDKAVRVTRVTPDGDETVEVTLPCIVTISNELGTPRYPTTAQTIKARKMKPTAFTPDALGVSAAELAPKVVLTKQFVPTVQGQCEFLSGGSPAELAQTLLARLRADGAIA